MTTTRQLLVRAGLVCLWFAVLGSGVGVIYAKHLSRQHFVSLETLRAERDQLEIDWGRLRLEQSTWATHGRVEQLAREKLSMHVPEPEDIVVVEERQ